MDEDSLFTLIMIIALVAMSAFFSASETAFSSLNLIRLRSRVDAGDKNAARTLDLAEKFDRLLSTILIGNNIVNIAAASLGTVLFSTLVGPVYGPTVSTVALTVIVLIFGEITPKGLAKEMPETLAVAFSPILRALVTLFTPLNFVFGKWKDFLARRFHSDERDTVTEGELVTMVSEAEKDGEITDRESELIRSAISFDDVEVEDVLIPRVDVVAVADDADLEQVADLFADSGYSRLPVYHETIDNIIGVVHEKDYFVAARRGETELEKLIAPALYTTPGSRISQLMGTMRESKHHMAIVVDEYGGTAGIVTLEDILEELVGEIWDEHDDVIQEVRAQSNGSWLIAGDAGVDDVAEELGIRDKSKSVSISGLVQEKLGDLPKVGDHFRWGAYEGIVTRTTHRRVQEIRLTPAGPDPEEEEL